MTIIRRDDKRLHGHSQMGFRVTPSLRNDSGASHWYNADWFEPALTGGDPMTNRSLAVDPTAELCAGGYRWFCGRYLPTDGCGVMCMTTAAPGRHDL